MGLFDIVTSAMEPFGHFPGSPIHQIRVMAEMAGGKSPGRVFDDDLDYWTRQARAVDPHAPTVPAPDPHRGTVPAPDPHSPTDPGPTPLPVPMPPIPGPAPIPREYRVPDPNAPTGPAPDPGAPDPHAPTVPAPAPLSAVGEAGGGLFDWLLD